MFCIQNEKDVVIDKFIIFFAAKNNFFNKIKNWFLQKGADIDFFRVQNEREIPINTNALLYRK